MCPGSSPLFSDLHSLESQGYSRLHPRSASDGMVLLLGECAHNCSPQPLHHYLLNVDTHIHTVLAVPLPAPIVIHVCVASTFYLPRSFSVQWYFFSHNPSNPLSLSLSLSRIQATRLLESKLNLTEQKWLVAYPVALFYSCFILITVF